MLEEGEFDFGGPMDNIYSSLNFNVSHHNYIIDLQKKLINLKEENFSDFISLINLSPFENINLVSIIIDEILAVYYIRPKSAHLFAKLVNKMKNSGFDVTDCLFQRVFMPEFNLRYFDRCISKVVLLYFCFKEKLINLEKIKENIGTFIENFIDLFEQLFIYCLFFGPELQANDESFLQYMETCFNSTMKNSRSPTAFRLFQMYDKLKENKWSLLKESRELGVMRNTVEYFIINDDVNGFLECKVDIDAVLDKNPFETSILAQSDISAIQLSALYGSINIIKKIVELKPKLLEKQSNDYTISFGVQAMYDPGNDKSAIEQSHTMYLALINGNTELLEYLKELDFANNQELSAKIVKRIDFAADDLPSDTSQHVFQCVKFNNIGALIEISRTNCDIDARTDNNMTALHLAASYGYSFMFHVIFGLKISRERSIHNAVNYFGQTFLHIASQCGSFDVIQTMVGSFGFDPNVKDNTGQTPLHIASCYGHMNVVVFLLQHGADPNEKDRYHLTPLLAAAKNGRTNALKALISFSKTDVEVTAEWGNNALHIASEEGKLHAVRMLVSSGRFDVKKKDKIQRTALDVAKGEDVVSYLRSFE